MNFWSNPFGIRVLQVTSADITQTIAAVIQENIILLDVQNIDELNARISFGTFDYPKITRILQKKGASYKRLHLNRTPHPFAFLRCRFILLIFTVILLFLTFFIPSRIFFVQIEGNTSIPTNQILQCVQDYGVNFGYKRRDLRSENIKTVLLQKLPSLKWAAVTTSGCVATVHVQEGESADEKAIAEQKISSIVAKTDGVIEEITVTQGTALCKPGQVVRKNQILVSGYEDHGFKLKGTNAMGEITAKTLRTVQVLTPAKHFERKQMLNIKTNYSIQIGKKLIKLYADSGNTPLSCVKLCKKENLTLPGGFILPVAVVKEQIICYNTSEEIRSDDVTHWLCEIMDSYVNRQLVGTVLRKNQWADFTQDLFVVSGEYFCREEIGRSRAEEMNGID